MGKQEAFGEGMWNKEDYCMLVVGLLLPLSLSMDDDEFDHEGGGGGGGGPAAGAAAAVVAVAAVGNNWLQK